MFNKDLLNRQNYLTIILISFPVFYIIGSFFLNMSVMIIGIHCLINYSKVNIKKKLIYIFSFLFFFLLSTQFYQLINHIHFINLFHI